MLTPEIKAHFDRSERARRLYEHAATEIAHAERKDPGHGLGHCLRVAHWTVRLLGDPRANDAAIAAALLHDIVNLPKDSPDRKRASELSAERARALLPRFGFEGQELAEICEAIRTHSFSRGEEPKSRLGDALQDADRLEALGAIGLYRVIVTGVQMGSEFFDEADPFGARRGLDDRRFSIDHFYVKLLKLPGTMRTETGRREAEKRAAYLADFLKQLSDELGLPLLKRT